MEVSIRKIAGLALTVVLVMALVVTGTWAYFGDTETASGNLFSGWAASSWTQTSQSDFEDGVLNNVDTSSVPGDVKKAIKSDWYNIGWSYRKKITIDHTKVSNTSQSNFPVLISRTDADWKDTTNGGHVGQSDGGDILFTSSDGTTKLSHQIERYTSSTGELIAWVKVLTLSPSTDTVIYIYYGNAACPDQWATGGSTWDTNYKIVYHLGDAGPTTAYDATSNANNGTMSGTASFGAAGKIDGATSYNGGYIAASGAPSISATGSFTYEFWINVTSYTNGAINDGSGSYFLDRTTASTPLVSLKPVGGQFAYQTRYDDGTGLGGPTGGTIVTGSWFYITMVRDYNTAFRLYVNGAQVATTADSGSKLLTPPVPKLARHATTANYLNGSLDEFRISNAARSADWIKTEYNNQNSPSTFYSLGGEEGPYITSDWYNTSWTRRCPTTITNNTGTALSGYQVKVAVTYDSDMQTDFDDIRFADSDGLTLLSHWRESYTASASAIFLVKVPSIPSGTKTIYMYYGHPTIGSASDGANTFEFFDEGDQLSSWTTGTVGSGSAGQSLTIGNLAPSYYVGSSDGSNYAYMKRDFGLTTNRIIEFDMQTDTSLGPAYVLDVAFLVSSAGYGQNFRLEGRAGEKSGFASKDNWTAFNWGVPASGSAYSTGVWHKAKIAIGPTQANGWIDDGLQLTSPYTLRTTAGNTFIGIEWSGRIDNIRVRKYASPEPTTSVGSEEVYVSPSTIASQVRDTAVAGARWDALFWSETLPANTNITFEVRASNSSFPETDGTLSWTAIGGTSPVLTGLPTGQYKQWRATLTTTDSSKTPVLNEVRLYYY
jgi:predicted ribosomally synthesized peptide with SipW-like signal peptide